MQCGRAFQAVFVSITNWRSRHEPSEVMQTHGKQDQFSSLS